MMKRHHSIALALVALLAFASASDAARSRRVTPQRTGPFAHRYHSYGKGRLSVTQAKRAVAVAVAHAEGIQLGDKQHRQVGHVEVSNKVTSRGTVLFKAEVAVAADSPLAKLAAKFGNAIPTKTVYGELKIAMTKPNEAAVNKRAHEHYQRRIAADTAGKSDWAAATKKLMATGHTPTHATIKRAAIKEYKWRQKANAVLDTVRARQELLLDLESGNRATLFGSSPKRFQREMNALGKQ